MVGRVLTEKLTFKQIPEKDGRTSEKVGVSRRRVGYYLSTRGIRHKLLSVSDLSRTMRCCLCVQQFGDLLAETQCCDLICLLFESVLLAVHGGREQEEHLGDFPCSYWVMM